MPILVRSDTYLERILTDLYNLTESPTIFALSKTHDIDTNTPFLQLEIQSPRNYSMNNYLNHLSKTVNENVFIIGTEFEHKHDPYLSDFEVSGGYISSAELNSDNNHYILYNVNNVEPLMFFNEGTVTSFPILHLLKAIISTSFRVISKNDPSSFSLYTSVKKFSDKNLETIKYPKRFKLTNSFNIPGFKRKVFISYSRKDVDSLSQLKRHFRPFSDKIDFWEDSIIDPGDNWNLEIKTALLEAELIILLISADFFNSNFIMNEELPRILGKTKMRGSKIISVILKPCLYSEYPEISKYQSINSPSNTIAEMSETERERTWMKLVTTVKNELF